MIEIQTFAPIFIPTLCRYELFKRCIESLQRCTYADQTDVYVGLDYPLNESHWEGYRKISEYVDTVTGFKSFTVFRRESNYGAKRNNRELREYILSKYDRFIGTEDDNVFSPNYLSYVNQGLERFKNDKRIIAVCSFSYPVSIPANFTDNVFFLNSYVAWGRAFWRDKYLSLQKTLFTVEYFDTVFHSYKQIFKLFRDRQYHLIVAITTCYKKKKYNGDLLWKTYLALNEDQYCLFPVENKLTNLGNDGSGENCKKNGIYQSIGVDQNNSFSMDFSDIKLNPIFANAVKNRFLKPSIMRYYKYVSILYYLVYRWFRFDIIKFFSKNMETRLYAN